MSEEEAINVLKNLMEKNKQIVKEAYKSKDINAMELVADEDREAIAIFKILDLYNKEKQKNKELTDEYMIQKHLINSNFLKDYISKDKIREKIKELESIEPADDDYNFEMQNDIHSKINILQELLEDNENHIPRID